MGIFNRLFGNTASDDSQPDIRFGRYSDSYKRETQYDAWDQALESFENEKYLLAYQQFFSYLKDEQEDNVNWREEKGAVHFELYQGSKKIVGVADPVKISAEAKIAHTEGLNVNFMRRLLEQNYSLKYSRYALDDDNNLTIRFDSFTLDGSPYKLYFALKELSTSADKQDDLLLDEFRTLEAVETDHLEALPEDEQKIKYEFIQRKIKGVADLLEKEKAKIDQLPGGYAYMLLNLLYELDYLTCPEGFMMETLERAHRRYFANDGAPTKAKIALLQTELQSLLEREKGDFFKEMYRVKSTFGITNPVNHDRVVSFIDGELPNMDWYQENNLINMALAIPGYIVGYNLFNYAIPQPDRDLFELYYRIMEPGFFKKLGFLPVLYNKETKKYKKKKIRVEIRKIVEKHLVRFPNFSPNTSVLNYQSMPDFARSYLLMVRDLDLSKR